jgi:hypothetical protein
MHTVKYGADERYWSTWYYTHRPSIRFPGSSVPSFPLAVNSQQKAISHVEVPPFFAAQFWPILLYYFGLICCTPISTRQSNDWALSSEHFCATITKTQLHTHTHAHTHTRTHTHLRFTIWPDDALMSVASLTLQELAVDDALCDPLAQQCMCFHRHAQQLSEK